MKTEAIKNQLELAENDLKRAKNELYQPMEDVVNYCVCVSARSALYRYLKALYLHLTEDEQIEIQEDLPLEELIQLCSNQLESVKELDFDNINCKHLDVRNTEEIYFCNDVDIVSHCTELAEKVRELLFEQLPPEIKEDLPVF